MRSVARTAIVCMVASVCATGMCTCKLVLLCDQSKLCDSIVVLITSMWQCDAIQGKSSGCRRSERWGLELQYAE
jgi:hypothetical protein